MTTPTSLRDTAIAAYKAATQAQRDQLVADARALMTPVLTDHLGKLALDPKNLTVAEVLLSESYVVFASPGGSVHFLVKAGAVRLARRDADRWVPFTEPLKSLVDVGKALA